MKTAGVFLVVIGLFVCLAVSMLSIFVSGRMECVASPGWGPGPEMHRMPVMLLPILLTFAMGALVTLVGVVLLVVGCLSHRAVAGVRP